ncbi:transposase [Streptomyces sp. NRRL S-455]|uniref:transposase n=1 Tax=Streptomyces sp. NRRL S-455 TaxID=1463908 RepID=UPI0022771002|nr:transposase [Streptomyces sp. NRRL S-455]
MTGPSSAACRGWGAASPPSSSWPSATSAASPAATPAAASGLSPVLSQSSKIRYSRSATGGDKALKRVFYQAAFCSIQRDPTSRTFYDRKRSEGKRHHQALIALVRRKINVLYAILRDRHPYGARPPLRLAA